jgi:hypothetical protein
MDHQDMVVVVKMLVLMHFKNLWSQPAVAAILSSGRIEVPEMPGRSNVISLLTTHVP